MLVLACVAQAACSPHGEPGGPATQVTVSIVPDGYAHTRSSYTWNEDEIRDIQIVVTTEDGDIHDVLYSDTPSDLHFTGQAGRLYKLWAAANLGGKVEAGSLEDFTENIRHVTKAGIERTGIPMYSNGGFSILVSENENHAVIPLTRMMARVDLNIDTKSLDSPSGFKVISVSVFNPVDTYTPFDAEVRKKGAANAGPSFDSASSQDISRLNNGGTIRLYAFENLQGTLLPGNRDPWRKVPSRIGDAGPRCTYIEIVCSYTTDTDTCDDITYRMYLGEDATTNFDVRRNTLYRLTLEPTEDEIRGGRGSWKIETGEWVNFVDVELFLYPDYMKLEAGGTATVTSYFVLTWPDGRLEGLDAYSSWSILGRGSQYVSLDGETGSASTVTVYGKSPGSAVITAAADYNGDTYSAKMEIDVVYPDPVYTTEYEHELVVTPGTVILAEGETVSFTATYITREYTLADGVRISNFPDSTSEEDVTELADWTVQSGTQYVENKGYGVFGWNTGSGQAVIKATYDSCTDTAAITTRAHEVVYSEEYEYELAVSPDSVTLAEGETVAFTATFITREYMLADGVRISNVPASTEEEDVTQSANWSVRSGSQYIRNKGKGGFEWVTGPGKAVVSATMDGLSDTAEITTLAHQVVYSTEYEYELAVSPGSATLAEGESTSLTATCITREYTLADGVRTSNVPASTTEEDVTQSANWSVRSGSQYIRNKGKGIFEWVSGPGKATVSATMEGLSDTAEITTLAHQIVYSSEYEYELVVRPDAATLSEGESISLTAACITREYTLADGVRVSSVPVSTDEEDVTQSASWSVRSGSQYVRNKGKGVFEWVTGPGMATVSATVDGLSDTIEITTLAHQIVYSSEYEYELVVSPDAATLAEGETTSFTATYVIREYTLADGVRVSNVPSSTDEEDVTQSADWSVRSGSQFVLNKGRGVFGWASGPGTAVIAATHQGHSDTATISASEPDPVPTLTASTNVQDTWGGNEYPVTITYDDGRGHLTDVTSRAVCSGIDFTGGIPSRLLQWDGSHIVAGDWWGMSGVWVSSSPTYTMTLSYGGLSVKISGTMHGFTGAEVSPTRKVWHYREVEDNGWNAPPVKIVLVGSERMEVSDDERFVDNDHILGSGIIGVGSAIPLYVEFTDPYNGYVRSGSTSFDVVTNVASLHAYINVYLTQGVTGETVHIDNASSISGAFFGNVGITSIEQGYPPYDLVVQQSIWYVDYRGEEHQVTSRYGQDDYEDSITISDEWSLETQWDARIRKGEDHLIEIDVNGFSASWLWGYVGG